MVLIGEDVSKRLDVTPAKFRLIVTKRHDICRNLIRVWVQKHQAGRDRQSQADSPARARTRPAATRGSIDVR
jgi:transposase